MEEHKRQAAEHAHEVSITDPFNAPSYVAWLDRWNDNNGRCVREEGSHYQGD